jgi:hypothetical protein
VEGIVREPKPDLRQKVPLHLVGRKIVGPGEAARVNVEERVCVEAIEFDVGYVVNPHHELRAMERVALLDP